MAAGIDVVSRILIVEDDRNVREVVAQILEHEGFSVRCAAHGAAAIDLMTRRYHPDLILLDLTMPVMNGWAFRAEQQQSSLLASIPVILLSSEPDLRGVADALGIEHAVTKPILVPELLRLVRSVLSGRR